MNEKKILVFDLDGTLAPSKGSVDNETSSALSALLENKMVAVISGGGFPQFEKQIIGKLSKQSNLKNLYVFPTKGGAMYEYRDEMWKKVYEDDLTPNEKLKIRGAVGKALNEVDFIPNESYGEKLEDRNSEFTFSALGQDAPYELKKNWDPDIKKRLILKNILDKYLPDFSVEVGGSTSIDITKKDVDKAYAIKKIIEILKIKKEEILFIGDALFLGGNDHPVLKTGVDTVAVNDYRETKDIIKKYL